MKIYRIYFYVMRIIYFIEIHIIKTYVCVYIFYATIINMAIHICIINSSLNILFLKFNYFKRYIYIINYINIIYII